MNLPDRWERYTPMGKVIPKTRMVAFKVPLKEHFLSKVDEQDKFSPSILMQRLNEEGTRLGVIIDLTFTDKYYNRKEFTDHDVIYKKIYVKGHVIPSEKVFEEFVDAVNSCKQEDSVVGVHCTHGVNRTGYLVCRYMIEELNIDPEEAISLFNEARGHSLERENYLEDLKGRQKGHRLCSQRAREPRKERWRKHKEDHPGWRQSSGQDNSQGGRGQDNFRSGRGQDNSRGGRGRYEPFRPTNWEGQAEPSRHPAQFDGRCGQSFGHRPVHNQAHWGGRDQVYNRGGPTDHFSQQSPRHSDFVPIRGLGDCYGDREQGQYEQAGWGRSGQPSRSRDHYGQTGRFSGHRGDNRWRDGPDEGRRGSNYKAGAAHDRGWRDGHI